MFSISVLGSVYRADFIVFVDEKIDSMNMRENALEETIIVFQILDIKDSFTM